ncbi:MAG TPA: hypothetical protein PKV16_06590 [Caldisericia bacterium]|nr:hypothetical protein [Caldisericia bacterium]HPF48819.1 hypothetical protein [Caldisericia bacterium]HPI84257.1 hypothetical protein [Caldisericia bacterium]HPQ93435.1 hypothetical protein [Caldisericia bacterium]HRV74893.1 hypothetical protein [Caldisericia bacterium]
MKYQIESNDTKKIVYVRISGDAETVDDFTSLVKDVEMIDTGIDYGCIVNICSMGKINTDIALSIFNESFPKISKRFRSFVLVATGHYLMLIKMFVGNSDNRNNVTHCEEEAEKLLLQRD